MKGAGPSKQVQALPPIFRAREDANALRLRTSVSIVNDAAGAASRILALTPISIGSPGYLGLGNLFPMLTSMSGQYAKFMITKLTIELVPVTAATSGGYVAVGFEPDEATTSGPPTSLTDVTSAVHSDVAQVTEIAMIELNVSEYFNDWKQCSAGLSSSVTQAGVVQVYCRNTGSVTDVAAIMQVEVDIHFCGFRF